MIRRDFVAGGTRCALVGLAGLAGLGARPAAPSVTGTGNALRALHRNGRSGHGSAPRADLVIRSGTLLDGTGARRGSRVPAPSSPTSGAHTAKVLWRKLVPCTP